MRLILPCLLLILISTSARAEEPQLIERKVLVKRSRLFLSAGPTYFARGDYYTSPGIAGSATWYPIESGGLDLQLAGFASFLNASANEMLLRASAKPDAQKPVALAMLGWRQSVGYGKVLAGDRLDRTIHFDLQVTAHLGSVITNATANPAASVGVGLLARFSDKLFFQIEVPVVLAREVRQNSSVALGVVPMLQAGGRL